MIICPVCGAEHPDGTYRCDATLENGQRCGKDLTNVSSTAGGGRAVVGGSDR